MTEDRQISESPSPERKTMRKAAEAPKPEIDPVQAAAEQGAAGVSPPNREDRVDGGFPNTVDGVRSVLKRQAALLESSPDETRKRAGEKLSEMLENEQEKMMDNDRE